MTCYLAQVIVSSRDDMLATYSLLSEWKPYKRATPRSCESKAAGDGTICDVRWKAAAAKGCHSKAKIQGMHVAVCQHGMVLNGVDVDEAESSFHSAYLLLRLAALSSSSIWISDVACLHRNAVNDLLRKAVNRYKATVSSNLATRDQSVGQNESRERKSGDSEEESKEEVSANGERHCPPSRIKE